MFPIKALPVTTPGIDLGLFRNIVSPETVNEIDGKRNVQPLSKFAELVEESFPDSIDPFNHVYQAFYFELPVQPFIELSNLQLLSTTATLEGLIVKGYASGSFAIWMEFLTEASKEHASQYLRVFANTIFGSLRSLPPFHTLNFKAFQDKTFALIKKDRP